MTRPDFTDWSHPRIRFNFDALTDFAATADEAAQTLARRTADNPKLVAAGKLTETASNADLAAWKSLANDWCWIASKGAEGTEPQCTLTGSHLRKAALDETLNRFFARFDASGARSLSPAEHRQLTAFVAMRFWAEREGHPNPIAHAADVVAINQLIREQRATAERIAA